MEIITREHYITKYPSGKIKTGELVLYKDGTLKYQTVVDNDPPNIIFNKKYKNIYYAKKKFKILKDKYFTF